ncbi:neuraminidase-like domain-containing protein [Actinomadura sp. 9N215]|uniref:Tc toxin subunit A-related protein n=1 Tax=Actinomadura sp. 9N215 TaxID=3375150 RepID=UPI0037ABCB21
MDYLIANPLRSDSGPYWHDANTMYDYFLLDVEMGACQQTTRIAQAIFSVQLFVQRVQLNLESVSARDDADIWKQWEWMKSYRIWEANQKVFLYPENYFQPELRAAKSPIFEAMENELMQKELTADNVEDALRHYLEQLDRVSRLRPIGAFTDDTVWPPTVLVVGGTAAKPREHYFRSWVNKNEWTPWRKVELDIDSDTVVPVVWNRRLHLFWPTFSLATEQSQVRMPQGTDPMPEPRRFWKVRLNWSRYVNGRWEPKKATKVFLKIEQGSSYDPDWMEIDYSDLITRIVTQFREYHFRPKVDPISGDLVIWCVDDFLRREGDDSFTTKSGFFRFSAGLDEVTVEQIKDRTAGYAATVPHVNYGDYSLDENHERVEYVDPDSELSGKVHIADPTKRSYEPENSLLALNQTPGDQLYRVLNLMQHPMDWERFVAFFSDGRRSYLVDPYLVSLPTLRERPSSAPGRDRRVLRAGQELAALAAPSAERTPNAENALVLPRDLALPGSRVAASTLGTGRVHADLAVAPKLSFRRFYHPHVRSFAGELNRLGVDGLFNRRLQTRPEIYTGPFNFTEHYKPDISNVPEAPGEPVEFAFGDAYAEYNWELFFHAPLLVAQRLSANRQFEQAQRWFHFIFDPTNRSDDGDPPQRYWITKPFFEATGDTYAQQRIEAILKKLAEGDPDTTRAVERWLANPFQPDVVARLRTTAYQKAVVMKYLDNLIAWGDHLFRQDTLESINQATQLYILADELLGRRPEEITGRADPAPQSFRQLLSGRPADAAVAAAENLVPVPAGDVQPGIRPGVNLAWLNYFRVPRNDKLVGYWDTVEDRLFKIRHCQNIEGVRRQVPLFGAPIDPNLLVRAAAAGVDLATVLDDISAPLPHYRFGPMLAKAKELAAEVTAFGNALLAALEKRDAEALARLRSGHELAVLDAAREVRHRQVKEADEALAALDRSRELARDRNRYYAEQLREPLNAYEKAQTRLHEDALDQQDLAALTDMAAAVVGYIPDFKIGSPTTVGGTYGGSNILSMLRGLSGAFGTNASRASSQGSQQLTLAGYTRRAQEWTFQAGQADIETAQFDKQILGAQIRQAIAAKELENHDLQRENAREVDRFMRDKFTSTELYDWLAGQLSTSYFQAYQLAYDVAKRAERSYRHELGVADSGFINFGYWDSLHKGLLAGERLSADLSRMDAAYLEANSREFELSKRISLAQLDPTALLRLKETGKCFVSLPEAFFDLDAPGHYLRRIKNLAITVPCVAGPYTSVNLTARLLHSTVRIDPVVGDGKKYARGTADPRFRDYTGPVQSIVTSTGQDDSGLFETDLRDERFLPFEGAGVISEWQLSLPDTFRQFDYESITDVVLHVRYTARDGGDNLAERAVGELHDALKAWLHSGEKSLYRVFSARREFSDQWSRFLAPTGAADPAAVFTIAKDRFPRMFHGEKLTIAKPSVVLVLSQEPTPDGSGRYLDAYPDGQQLTAEVTTPTHQTATARLTADPVLAGQPRCAVTVAGGQVHEPGQEWTVSLSREEVERLPQVLVRDGRLNPDAVLDLLLIWQYTVQPA